MTMLLKLVAAQNATSTASIMATAHRAGIELTRSNPARDQFIPELVLGGGKVIRHTGAILRYIAKATDSSLFGNSFFEESQVDNWLEWASLNVDDVQFNDFEKLKSALSALEGRLSSRTFLVGQRMTVADIWAAVSLNGSIQKNGLDVVRVQFPASVRWLMTCVHQLKLNTDACVQKTEPTKQTEKPKAAPAPVTEKKTPPAETPAPTNGENATSAKKDEKRKAKEEEKRKKEEKKKAEEEKQRAAAEAKFKGPDLTLHNFEEHPFGNLFIQSHASTKREWTLVKSIEKSMDGTYVWIRARVQNNRKQGGKLCFLTLRQHLATIQAVTFGSEIAGFSAHLPDESVVDVYGKVTVPENPVLSCSQSLVELQVEKIYCIGRSCTLPLQYSDCSRPDEDYEKDSSLVKVGQDVRLDNRIIDLRTVANQGILKLQSGVGQLFREYLTKLDFTEIHTPKLIGAASEGGADVFRVDYFEGNAYLAQSPQLYKQMALMTDLDRVFEIGPVFRAEKSFTHRHMTEFVGLDMEMTFKEHYHEVLDVLDGLFNHIFTGLTERYGKEIEAVKRQHPFKDLKWQYPCLRLTFEEAVNLLKEHGPAVVEEKIKNATNDHEREVFKKHLESVKNHHVEDDLSTEDERVLGVVMHNVKDADFYIVDKFPKAVRPFYTMSDPCDERWTNSYDFFLRGEEITSGAQRIHDPDMLLKKAADLGVEVDLIKPYIDSFKYGAYPHAGAGIGLERVVMLFLSLNNIRKSSMFPRDPKRLNP